MLDLKPKLNPNIKRVKLLRLADLLRTGCRKAGASRGGR